MPFPICLSVYGDTQTLCQYLQEHVNADLFEIRLDLSPELDLAPIRAATSRPLIFASHANPELLAEAINFADYLDLGSKAGRDARPPNDLGSKAGSKTGTPKQIVSFHGTEEDPVLLWAKLKGDAIAKIVLETGDYQKISQLLNLNSEDKGKAICFGMGDVGAFSRVLSVFKGAPWIYASLAGQSTASGQFTIDDLINLYRVKRFSSPPEVFGILGNPISHSRSPAFHNQKFAEKNLPWIYLRFPCVDLDSLMAHAVQFGIKGLSVTHPFKEKIIPYLKSKSKEVELLRSCNTVSRKEDGWHGINTDVYGFEQLLRINNINLRSMRVAILGAGGAARAVAYVVRQQGGHLIFLNRTHYKAETLATVFDGNAIPISEFASVEYDVLIQTTPVGMRADDSPVNPDAIRPKTTVIDVLYEPRETFLLRKARALGCRTINGEQWFTSQAEAQCRWWMRC